MFTNLDKHTKIAFPVFPSDTRVNLEKFVSRTISMSLTSIHKEFKVILEAIDAVKSETILQLIERL